MALLAGLLTQALCIWLVAILPSSVIAYLRTDSGRRSAARCSSASLACGAEAGGALAAAAHATPPTAPHAPTRRRQGISRPASARQGPRLAA
jgi:hypothetical protein